MLELVEGPTLADRVAKGSIPVDEALHIAKQIAEALEAAHELGIIHRDLKPANIKLRDDGTVKVLDFGLAKAMEPASALSPALTASPTITTPAQMTGVGMILGTAAYMSPEQARGKPVDKRTDIWAFGCVLYEMLTGLRLFDGPTVSDTLADVLRAPIDFDALPKTTPRVVCDLQRRCLDRNTSTRLRDMGEARVAIDTSFVNPAATTEATAPLAATFARSRPWPWIAATAVLAVGSIGATYVAYRTAGRPVARPLLRFADGLETGLSGGVEGPAVALSPDGERLAYVTADAARTRHVAVRRLDDAKGVVLAGTEGGAAPTFSPDGRWVAFYAGAALKKIAVEGGAAVTICSLPAGAGVPRGGIFWADDWTLLFAGQRSPVMRVSSDGGTPSPITTLDEKKSEVSHRAAQLLPGGTLLFESSTDNNAWEDATIYAQSLKTGDRKMLVTGGYFGRYLHGDDPFDGHLLYMRGEVLFAAPLDARRLVLTGPALPVLEDVAGRSQNGLAHFAFTSSGTLAYIAAEKPGSSSLFWFDAAGGPQVMQTSQDFYLEPRISPDGARIAVRSRAAAATGVVTLGIFEWATGRTTRLAGLEGIASAAEWAPDGKHIVVALISQARSGPGIYWARADGAGEAVRIVAGPNFVPFSFSPDGKRLIYGNANAAEPRLWTLPLDLTDPEHPKPGKPDVFVEAKGGFIGSATFSPDGRWIAYQADEDGRGEIYVRPFPSTAGRWQVSTNGGSRPVWSHRAPELFYLQNAGRNALTPRVSVMVVPYTTSGDAFSPGQPRPWTANEFPVPNAGRPDFDLTPDGKRFLGAMRGASSDESPGVTFLVNFANELRRKVPSK